MILILFSFFLDSLLSNYLPYSSSYLTWFQPCLFVTVIVTLFYQVKNKKKFLRQGVAYTILGSLLFGNSVFLRLISFFLIIGFLTNITKKYRKDNILYILTLIGSILIHYVSYYFIIIMTKEANITFYSLCSQFVHSLLLNIIIGYLLYYFLGIKKLVR